MDRRIFNKCALACVFGQLDIIEKEEPQSTSMYERWITIDAKEPKTILVENLTYISEINTKILADDSRQLIVEFSQIGNFDFILWHGKFFMSFKSNRDFNVKVYNYV